MLIRALQKKKKIKKTQHRNYPCPVMSVWVNCVNTQKKKKKVPGIGSAKKSKGGYSSSINFTSFYTARNTVMHVLRKCVFIINVAVIHVHDGYTYIAHNTYVYTCV